jgi:hypothetical protein
VYFVIIFFATKSTKVHEKDIVDVSIFFMTIAPLSKETFTNRNLSATSAPLREIIKGSDITTDIRIYRRLRYYNSL